MKHLISFLFCLISISSYGQLQGKFIYGQDGHVYFCLTNPTGYAIPVVWSVNNFKKNEQRLNQGYMPPHKTFTYGPNAQWVWEKEECFAITYVTNGQTVSWTCPVTDPALRNRSNISFKGKGACRHGGCSCENYISAHNGGKCVCGHWDYVHN